MSMIPLPVGSYSNQTGSATVTSKPTVLTGFYVNNTTSGTIIIKDGATAVSGTITPAIGWHFYPVSLPSGLVITIANTLDVTLVFNQAGQT